jgi:hypothetical protein
VVTGQPPPRADAPDASDPPDPPDPLLVGLELNGLGRNLGHLPFAFRHGFAHDPRFSIDVLAPLVASLPAAWIRANAAQYSPHEARGLVALPRDTDLDAVLRALSTDEASIRVYNLEHTAEFRPLAPAITDAVRVGVGKGEGGLATINLGAFFASPAAVTPGHPDRHHNLLCQVSGSKDVWVEVDPDRRRHHERVVDYLAHPEAGAPVLPPAQLFHLEPGDAVYIPPYAFHWTTVADEPALGFSIGFSTPATNRSSRMHDWDTRARRHGRRIRPSRPGGPSERVKAHLADALSWYRQRRTGQARPVAGTVGRSAADTAPSP